VRESDAREKDVALKLVDRTEDIGRLRDEVLLAQEVTHRNVCRTYDLERAGGHWLVKMEYVRGETLASRVMRAPISVEDAVTVAQQIVEGLAAAHAKRVVHRDLKPENVMIEAGARSAEAMMGHPKDEGARREDHWPWR
jgi:serine/threonine protein kinase